MGIVFTERDFLEELVFIHAKAVMIVWGITYALYPPAIVVHELGHTLVYASALFAIVGSVMGISGLLMTNSKNLVRRHQGDIIEEAGLFIAICGPLGFFITAGYLTLKLNATVGYSFTVFAYALCAFMFSRIVVVRRRIRQGY